MNVKNRVSLYNWQLYLSGGKYFLSGIAEYYPGYGKGIRIGKTSSIQKFSLNDDVLYVETKHTIYSCPLKYMTVQPYMNVVMGHVWELSELTYDESKPEDMVVSVSARIRLKNGGGYNYDPAKGFKEIQPVNVREDEFFRHVEELQKIGQEELKKREEEDDKRMLNFVRDYEDSIYLEIHNLYSGDKLAYHMGDELGIQKSDFHCGDFQDSILYVKYLDKTEEWVDFRYFPHIGNGMETYSWSDNIQRAVIRNETEKDIFFNDEKIMPGETKVFENKRKKRKKKKEDLLEVFDELMAKSEKYDKGE